MLMYKSLADGHGVFKWAGHSRAVTVRWSGGICKRLTSGEQEGRGESRSWTGVVS